MKFRTEFSPSRAEIALSPAIPVALVGSCFTDNIASKMRAALWRGFNPLGTLFNPLSIAQALSIMTEVENDNDNVISDSLFKAPDGMTKSWLFDSSFAAAEGEECEMDIMEACRCMADILRKGRTLCVTFGTAWCYFLKKSGTLVANCHKINPAEFLRRRVTVEEIVECWTGLIQKLEHNFPGLKIIFTVSPVRHLKDGFAGNSRSKAVLSLAVEEICSRFGNAHYFPAYEIMNDDLRDYRFYASDLVHPSEEGIDYIWEKFCETYLDASAISLLREGEKLAKALSHRQLFQNEDDISEELKQAIKDREIRIEEMIRSLHAMHERVNPGTPGLFFGGIFGGR